MIDRDDDLVSFHVVHLFAARVGDYFVAAPEDSANSNTSRNAQAESGRSDDGIRIADMHHTHSSSCHGQKYAPPPRTAYTPGVPLVPGS